MTEFGSLYGEEIERFVFKKDLTRFRHLSLSKNLKEGNRDRYVLKVPQDPFNEYEANCYGYRSPDFGLGTELVFAGCSFTFGSGVPESNIWGSVVAEELGVSYANLGDTGRSIYYIVQTILSYVREFENPKILLCLFPDYKRFVAPSVPKLFVSEEESSNSSMGSGFSLYSRGLIPSARYIKRPVEMSEVIPEEFAMMLSIHAIYALDDYCSSSGIKFLWGTWNSILEDYFVNNKDLLGVTSFVDLKNSDWHTDPVNQSITYLHEDSVDLRGGVCSNLECSTRASCHEDLRLKSGNNFHVGLDVDSNESSHWGTHRHAHVAEKFLSRLEEL